MGWRSCSVSSGRRCCLRRLPSAGLHHARRWSWRWGSPCCVPVGDPGPPEAERPGARLQRLADARGGRDGRIVRSSSLAALAAIAALALAVAAPAALGAGWAKLRRRRLDHRPGGPRGAGARVVAAWPRDPVATWRRRRVPRLRAHAHGVPRRRASRSRPPRARLQQLSQRPAWSRCRAGCASSQPAPSPGRTGPTSARRSPRVSPPGPGAIAVQLAGRSTPSPLLTAADRREHGERGPHTLPRRGPGPDGSDIQALIGGGCARTPGPRPGRLGARLAGLVLERDGPGRLPHGAARPRDRGAVGGATKVPQSESPANNGFHPALACAAVCRLVYAAQTTPIAP